MLIKVKRKIAIPDENTGRRDLDIGEHDVPDSLREHWYIKGLFNSGAIEFVDKKVSDAQRNYKSEKRLREEGRVKSLETVVVNEESKETAQIAEMASDKIPMELIDTRNDNKKEEKAEEPQPKENKKTVSRRRAEAK